MQEVVWDLMITVWGHYKLQNDPVGSQVLNLLWGT